MRDDLRQRERMVAQEHVCGADAMSDEDRGAGRRLLDRLQQRVGRRPASSSSALSTMTDAMRPPSAGGRRREKALSARRTVFDAEWSCAGKRFVLTSMDARSRSSTRSVRDAISASNLPEGAAEPGSTARGCPKRSGRSSSGSGEERGPRHPVGERRLADAGRPRQQPGMMHAAARERLGKDGLRGVLAVKRPRLARMGKVIETVRFGKRFDVGGQRRPRHQSASARRWAVTACQTAVSTLATGRWPSIRTQRCDSASAISRKPSRNISWVSMRSAS